MMGYTASGKLRKYEQPFLPPEPRGEWAEREELILKYAPLIKTVAGRLAMRLPPQVDQDDLMSAGIMGLLDAINKYDPEKGVAFKSYAEFRIRGAMLDELRAMDWVPRSVRKSAKRVEEAYGRVERREMRPAMDEEVAEELDIGIDAFHKLLEEVRGIATISEDELGDLISDEKVTSLWQIYHNNMSTDPLSSLDLVELRDVLAGAIESLPENERLVVTLYYYEELTMKEIGSVMGYTESRISQLHTKAVMRLRHRVRDYFRSGI
jgi:RNA polymerase sigma factor for flagellar operon FliA